MFPQAARYDVAADDCTESPLALLQVVPCTLRSSLARFAESLGLESVCGQAVPAIVRKRDGILVKTESDTLVAHTRDGGTSQTPTLPLTTKNPLSYAHFQCRAEPLRA
jgi:hypothetical protein